MNSTIPTFLPFPVRVFYCQVNTNTSCRLSVSVCPVKIIEIQNVGLCLELVTIQDRKNAQLLNEIWPMVEWETTDASGT